MAACVAGLNGVGAASYPGTVSKGVTGLLQGNVTQFFTQLDGATLIGLYSFGFTFVVFKIANAITLLRVSEKTERVAYDAAYKSGRDDSMKLRSRIWNLDKMETPLM
jgi:ammonia channel protein AmtB